MKYAKEAGNSRWAVAAPLAIAATVVVAGGAALLFSLGDRASTGVRETVPVEPPACRVRDADREPPPGAVGTTAGSARPGVTGDTSDTGLEDATSQEAPRATRSIAEEAPPAPGAGETLLEEAAAAENEKESPRTAPAEGEGLRQPPEPEGTRPAAEELPEEPPAPGERPASKKPHGGATAAAAEEQKWSPPRFGPRSPEHEMMLRVIRGYGLTDPDTLRAMGGVPRIEFVPQRRRRLAYADSPLPIGYGQTISQPYIVAEMTRRLRLGPNSRVLEIGTGSGYQAAVLTEFTPHVFTIEIIKPLADSAKKRLDRLGYHVVKARHADGYYGWPEEAPFDAIIVTCAAGHIPPPLLRQLSRGGRMVIPVGGVHSIQSLMLVEKDEAGTVQSRSLMGVRFVPFVRREK